MCRLGCIFASMKAQDFTCDTTVSVIIPTYNAGWRLHRAVESVFAQTMDCRIIVIDDGSSDSSIEDLHDVHDERLTILSIPHRGVSVARNFGIKNAGTTWIAFLDADDTLHPAFVERMIGYAGTTNADVVTSPVTHRPSRPLETIVGHDAAVRVLYQRGVDCSACGKLWRRALFGDGDVFVPQRRFEDLEAVPRLLYKAHRVTVTYENLYRYTFNSESFINSPDSSRMDALWASHSLFEWAEASGDSMLVKAVRARAVAAACNALRMCYRLGSQRRRQQIHEAIELLRCHRRYVFRDTQAPLTVRLAALISGIL